jgi:hypothetical protein
MADTRHAEQVVGALFQRAARGFARSAACGLAFTLSTIPNRGAIVQAHFDHFFDLAYRAVGVIPQLSSGLRFPFSRSLRPITSLFLFISKPALYESNRQLLQSRPTLLLDGDRVAVIIAKIENYCLALFL